MWEITSIGAISANLEWMISCSDGYKLHNKPYTSGAIGATRESWSLGQLQMSAAVSQHVEHAYYPLGRSLENNLTFHQRVEFSLCANTWKKTNKSDWDRELQNSDGVSGILSLVWGGLDSYVVRRVNCRPEQVDRASQLTAGLQLNIGNSLPPF